MNITIDTTAAQKNEALGSAKMTGVSKTSEKTAAKAEQTAKNYDTLDLSESAVQYLAKTENENTATENGGESQAENAVSKAAAELVSESSDDTETIDSTELYSYTDDQLSKLLSKGEITQLEYNNEMAKRASSETE